jgi:AraC-like DNA-binding protein
MNIMHENIDFPLSPVLKVKWREMPHFTYPWHFHREHEIIYVIKGHGISFVADSYEHFRSGDLVLLGSNLPHCWRSDKSYYSEKNKKQVNYIVIQFPENILHGTIFDSPEFHPIKDLLTRSARGIRFSPSFSIKMGKKIIELTNSKGIDRIIQFFQILADFAKTDDYKLLAGELYSNGKNEIKDKRLTEILNFINRNYRDGVELDKIAEIAHLHPAAFCRFFREKTGKTLTRFVNDMRISYACKLIIDGELSISEICFESGFNNLSSFNRTFKQNKKISPTDYRHSFFHK